MKYFNLFLTFNKTKMRICPSNETILGLEMVMKFQQYTLETTLYYHNCTDYILIFGDNLHNFL